MIDRQECIDAAEKLAHGNNIDRRNAARSIADYCRIILNEIGNYHSGYVFVKDLSIKHRYRLLSAAIPELLTFEELFETIDKLRINVDHNDKAIPSINELEILIKDMKTLNQIYEKKIYLDLKKRDISPYQKLLEDWNIVLNLYDNLDNYLFYDKQSFNDIVNLVRNYFPIAKRFKELDDQTITHTRIDLLNLQIDLRKLYEQRRKDEERRRYERSKTIAH
jgi:hypothetical protein